uniref:ubiquitinyl hydrolase 1 n=1 Tax=Scleropages formosus TaxID=113540 RepID=A0A8C9SSD2_SCLFO
MCAAADRGRRRRPSPRMYIVQSDYRVEDHLEGAIRLPRGSLCQVQEGGRGELLWVKIERQVLVEVPTDHAALLEAVSDPEIRLLLFFRPQRLQRLATLPLGAELQVQVGQSVELVGGILRYRGPLTGGSTAVYFGVQLKVMDSGAGRGSGNGSYKGHQFFHCPEGCGIFVAVNKLSLPSSRVSSGNTEMILDRSRDRGFNHSAILPRTADCNPKPGPGPSLNVILCLFMQDSPMDIWDGRFHSQAKVPRGTSTTLRCSSDVPLVDLKCIKRFKIKADVSLTPLRLYCNVSFGWLDTDVPLCFLFPDRSCLLLLSPLPPPFKDPRIHQSPTRSPSVKLCQSPSFSPASKLRGPTSPSAVDQLCHSPRTLVPLSPTKPEPERDDDQGGRTGPALELELELEVGSMVEVNDPPLYGVIRWIGKINGVSELVAGLELDQELTAATDGSYLGERHFRCPPNKGLFVKLRNCRRDSRFPAPEMPANQVERCNSIAFAEWSSERVEDNTPPLYGEAARECYSGWKKGIQGHLNSCYLDASLFSLFSCSSAIDWILLWPATPQDGHHCYHAQDLLRCEIVNPLRRNGYVCASKTMALRRLLEAESTDAGFTSQEKDPEEFINKLFQLLRVEPLLRIRSLSHKPQECHLYQLFPPPRSPLRVATVQILLETSFVHAGLKFAEAPSCLLLLMPRFGKDYKMFDAILPSLTLDITDLLDDTLRECSICQSVAEWECTQCYEDLEITPGRLKQYCNTCNTQVHSHRKRLSHAPGKVGVPGGPWAGPVHGARQRMALFAVTCIQTSHYVSFVRYGPLATDWLFFDSMADREGGENGFNVPQVRACPEVSRYLSMSEKELSRLELSSLRDPARRLLCDSYMCLYHSPQLSLYK